MHTQEREYQSFGASEPLWNVASLPEADLHTAEAPTRFYGEFTDCMEMYASAQTVASYLNAHQEWFCRCSHPMKVEPLGDNGYALGIGRFGSFGYEVEPKVGLQLLSPQEGVYPIKTIPIPGYFAPGYEVDFKAVMELVETSVDSSQYSGKITRVEWQLDLAVYVQFPKFIHRLPKSMIQSTGDRLLNQIVRQVSRRLTYKVQQDFYQSLNLPSPLKSKRAFGR